MSYPNLYQDTISQHRTLFHIAISIKYCPGGHFNIGHYYVLQFHPQFFGGVCVVLLFSFCCCPIMCHYVLSSLLRCLLQIPHKNDVWFVFTSSCLQVHSCLIYVICVCLCIVVSNTYCVVFLLCFSLSCVPYLASFFAWSIFSSPCQRQCELLPSLGVRHLSSVNFSYFNLLL